MDVNTTSVPYWFRYTPRVTAAALIRQSRERAGLTQHQLAAAARTSQPTVAAYESGRQSPRADTLERLLAACGRQLATRPLDASRTGPIARRVEQRRDDLLTLAGHHGAHDLQIFGSVARGEDTARSDLDLLVRLHPDRRPTLLRVAGLADELGELLGCPIDVTTVELLRPEIRDEVLAEAVPL
jgi:predicted nucleotidyltransferase/DNA-binding XRE family transcriptional regulator